jgi:hypothetical protein
VMFFWAEPSFVWMLEMSDLADLIESEFDLMSD